MTARSSPWLTPHKQATSSNKVRKDEGRVGLFIPRLTGLFFARPLNPMCKHGIRYLESLQNFLLNQALWINPTPTFTYSNCAFLQNLYPTLSADVKYSAPYLMSRWRTLPKYWCITFTFFLLSPLAMDKSDLLVHVQKLSMKLEEERTKASSENVAKMRRRVSVHR